MDSHQWARVHRSGGAGHAFTDPVAPATHSIGKRQREPEKEPHSLDKLTARLEVQLLVGEMPRTCYRRAPTSERLNGTRANLKRRLAKQRRAQVALRGLRG